MGQWLISNPNSTWPSRVPEIATTDPVLGGAGGPANVPHQVLADRTEYLKTSLDTLKGALEYTVENLNIDALTLRVEELETLLGALKNACDGHDNGIAVAIEGLEPIAAELARLKARIDGLSVGGGSDSGSGSGTGSGAGSVASLFPFSFYCS